MRNTILLFFCSLLTWNNLQGQSPGDFVITEFMADPNDVTDDQGEYVEIFNTTGMTIDINCCRVRDNSAASAATVSSSLAVPKGGLVLFGKPSVPGADVYYSASGGFSLNNDADNIILECPDGLGGYTTIASLSYSIPTLHVQ